MLLFVTVKYRFYCPKDTKTVMPTLRMWASQVALVVNSPPANAVRHDWVSTHTYDWFHLKNSSLGELGSNSLYKDGPNIIQQHVSLWVFCLKHFKQLTSNSQQMVGTRKLELTGWCKIRNFLFTEESLFAEELLIFIYFNADRAWFF